MKEKLVEQGLLVFIATFVTILTILISHSAMVNEVQPVPFFPLLFSVIYLIAWLVLIIFAIRRYYSVILLLFGLFWLSSFVILIFLMLSTLLSNTPTGIIASLQSVFYAPLYGLTAFFPLALARGIGALLSILFGLTAILCVPRRPNSMSRKDYKKMKRAQG